MLTVIQNPVLPYYELKTIHKQQIISGDLEPIEKIPSKHQHCSFFPNQPYDCPAKKSWGWLIVDVS